MILLLIFLSVAYSDDPADSWLNYAAWAAPNEARVTMVNTTWKVPSNPKRTFGSNAPGWWFGIQTTKGDGALIQPILAYGYQGKGINFGNKDNLQKVAHETQQR